MSASFPTLDPLSAVLQHVRVRVTSFNRWEHSGKRHIATLSGPGFVTVLKGSCEITVDNSPNSITLGEFGSAITLYGERSLTISTGNDERTILMAGELAVEDAEGGHLIKSLPTLLTTTIDASLRPLAEALENEASQPRMGSGAVVSGLIQVVMDHAVRHHVTSLNGQASVWLKAMMSPEIGPALTAIHSEPGKPWTVQALAEKCAMSRSTFAERFTTTVGEPPLKYLTEYRFHRAADMLCRSRLPIKEISARVGYESLAAFSNAFKRATGNSPAAYRDQSKGKGEASTSMSPSPVVSA